MKKKLTRATRNKFIAVALGLTIKNVNASPNNCPNATGGGIRNETRLNSHFILPYTGKVGRTTVCSIMHIKRKKYICTANM